MLDALPDQLFRIPSIFSNKIPASSNIMAVPHATGSSSHLFPLQPTGKQLLLKQQMTSLQIAAQRELRLRIVRERHVPWCRTETRRHRESGFSSGFKGSVRYMAHKQCCEITTHDFVVVFVVVVDVVVVVVFLLYIFDRHFRC